MTGRLVAGALALAAGCAPAAAADVLVIGDSLEVGTGPHLRRELSGTPVEIDARTGRPSGEGVAVLRARLAPEHDVVVFDLGVNDPPSQPGRLAADLDAARELAGDRCLVVATLSRPPLAGVPVTGLNRAVRGFAADAPGTVLVDWRAAVVANPSLMNPDAVHPTPDGYAFRARLVARSVRACREPQPEPAAEPAPRPAPRAAVRSRPTPLRIRWGGVASVQPVAAVIDLLADCLSLGRSGTARLRGLY